MELTKENIKQLLGIITFAVLLFVFAQNIGIAWGGIQTVMGLFTPFVIGLSMAFILNVLMQGVEKRLSLVIKSTDRKKSVASLKRGLALLISLSVVVGLVLILFFMVVPEFKRTIETVAHYLPEFANKSEVWISKTLSTLPLDSKELPKIEMDWKAVNEKVTRFLGEGSYAIFSTTIGVTASILGGLINLILGFVFSLYVLLQKETLGRQFKKLLMAYLSPKHVTYVLKVATLSHSIFSKFVAGQFLEAFIIGMLCYLGMLVFSMPYALVISSLVAVTALIPIFGALIGTVAGAFLIMIIDPMKALWFMGYIIVLQQVEGNLIYPRVVGQSIGLPGIWVLVAVTLGGSAFGIPGMLIGVPLTSVVYSLLREAVQNRVAVSTTSGVVVKRMKPLKRETE